MSIHDIGRQTADTANAVQELLKEIHAQQRYSAQELGDVLTYLAGLEPYLQRLQEHQKKRFDILVDMVAGVLGAPDETGEQPMQYQQAAE